MSKILKFGTSYVLWVVTLLLGIWFLLIARTSLTGVLSLFYTEGNLTYGHAVDFADKVFVITVGLGWLAMMIITEHYYRKGVEAGNLIQRFARVTGPIVLGIFVADLILFWLQGISGGNVLRWLLLVIELGIAIALIVEGRRPKLVTKPS